jgi:hypothetical protein
VSMTTDAGPVDSGGEAKTGPSSGIVWIASFPRSGNTWVRTFLHNLSNIQSGEEAQQDINEIHRLSTWELDKRYYAELLGFMPRNDQRDVIAATRPKVHELIVERAGGVVLIKTHNALVMDCGYPTVNFAVTAGAIYIVRNPLDVAISYAHHLGSSIDFAIEQMATTNAEARANDRAVHEIYGTWSQNVDSWTRTPHRALHLMRYEDMLEDPERTFGGLARYMLLNPTPEQLSVAIERSSFMSLQAQENEKGFREKPDYSDARFFREGRSGQWQKVLTQKQIDRIAGNHEEQMQRFRYLPLE